MSSPPPLAGGEETGGGEGVLEEEMNREGFSGKLLGNITSQQHETNSTKLLLKTSGLQNLVSKVFSRSLLSSSYSPVLVIIEVLRFKM